MTWFKQLFRRWRNPHPGMREAGFIAQDCELEDSVQAGRGTVLSGVKADAHVRIEPGARLTQCHLAEFSNVGTGVLLHDVSLGRFSYIAERSRLNQVRLGGFCSIGPECMFGFGRHPVDRLSTHPIIYSSSPPVATSWLEESTFLERAPITVGHDVFIGARVFIADGVKVGEGAVIGAGAIVTKDVAPYEVVGGVPAKRIKMRFSDSDIEELGQLAWWFWPVEVLKEARPLLDQHEPRLLVEFARAQGLIPTSRSNP